MTSRPITTQVDGKTAALRVAVIMAGGSGERFWPLSRRRRPKQLLCLTDERQNMLSEAVNRIAPLIPPQQVYVVTSQHLVDPIRQAQVGVPDENVIAEPCKRNTSGCLAYATAVLLARFDHDGSSITMTVTTADHLIGDPQRFRDTVEVALGAAEREAVLVTLGVVPDRPETGYGYIQVAGDLQTAVSTEARAGPDDHGSPIPVHPVVAFHEKPNRERAEDFLATGRYFWNSGMFFWRVSTFLAELEVARPQLHRATLEMAQALRENDDEKVGAIFEGLEDVSIDYALMEHAKHVAVVRADFPWDDVGTWSVLDRTHAHDPNGNVTRGDPVIIDCEDSIIYNEAGAEDMAVSVIGAQDLVVVVSHDAVLVVPKDRAQDARRAVQELKRRNAKQI